MDYVPKVGDWILYSKEDGLKMGVVRYVKERKATHRLTDGPIASITVFYTDDDQVTASEVLEVRT